MYPPRSSRSRVGEGEVGGVVVVAVCSGDLVHAEQRLSLYSLVKPVKPPDQPILAEGIGTLILLL